MDYAVRFTDVRKEYPLYQHITAGVKSFLFNLPRSISAFRKTRFNALKGVSFEVRKGETFGIIGRNGSGKSTILSLIADVIRQDGGSVEINGKMSSLLELGAGFHPDLSGIENIIMNGILMGSRKVEILDKADEIIRFSELGEFIYQPLRTYSSGMQMRLGFSVAIHIEPEILLIDEVLAVGDLSFQEKCMGKMMEFKKSGATIIIVSHDMATVAKLCDRVALIDSGSIMHIGEPVTVIKEYLRHIGHPIDVDIEEDQTLSKKDIQVEVEEAGIFDNANLVSETVAEPSISLDTAEIPPAPVPTPSWWDSPVIIAEYEALITGTPNVYFCDFLKQQYMIESLERGLSICNRLRGIENKFIKESICIHFDVVQENEISSLINGNLNFHEDCYDLILCVDVLHRIKDLYSFLKDLNCALKSKGIIIAFEYIGPNNCRFSNKEIQIATMIYNALNQDATAPDFRDAFTAKLAHSVAFHTASAIGSTDVIPMLERFFKIITIRYFGGPLYELILNLILDRIDLNDKRDSAIIRSIIRFEQILRENYILENHYAMIIAKKDGGA